MGQKVIPLGFRVGVNRDWDSRWFADGSNYSNYLITDIKIRDLVFNSLRFQGVSSVIVERPANKLRVFVHTSRPGVIIGKKGNDIEKIKNKISNLSSLPLGDVSINIVEVKKPECDAKIIADSVSQQLEKRVSFRRAMKRSMQSAMRLGCKGIRINCSGRLGGAEIARMEWYREGRVPLHTIRADIGYGVSSAFTTYGVIGVKVWVYSGDFFESKED